MFAVITLSEYAFPAAVSVFPTREQAEEEVRIRMAELGQEEVMRTEYDHEECDTEGAQIYTKRHDSADSYIIMKTI
jgi:hypothetical protein